jgi:hypothetical protein
MAIAEGIRLGAKLGSRIRAGGGPPRSDPLTLGRICDIFDRVIGLTTLQVGIIERRE